MIEIERQRLFVPLEHLENVAKLLIGLINTVVSQGIEISEDRDKDRGMAGQ